MNTATTAAVFRSPGTPLQLQQFPMPELMPGEVLVKVLLCTLCGSDLHSFQGHRSTPTPTILGHEIIGRVHAVGPGHAPADLHGRPLTVGQRVTWSVTGSCGTCFFCQHALPQKCEKLFKYGHQDLSHPLSGGLAEHCLLREGTAILPIPDSVPDLVACPANCATATVAAAFRAAGQCKDQAVLIQGVGMLGLTASAMARWHGARAVIVCDPDAQRLRVATQFGATHCADGSSRLTEVVSESTDDRGVDLAFDFSGNPEAIEIALPLLRIGGRYAWVGAVSPTRPISVIPEQIVRRMLTIIGIHNYAPDDLRVALDFLEQTCQTYPWTELVAGPIPLADIAEAFQQAIEARPVRLAVQP